MSEKQLAEEALTALQDASKNYLTILQRVSALATEVDQAHTWLQPHIAKLLKLLQQNIE